MIRRNLPAITQSQSRHPRRGALFNYYMVYLMMTAAVMAAAGICLHSLLRADQADSVIGWHLQSLLRMERQLRQDAANSGAMTVVDGNLICQVNPSEVAEAGAGDGTGVAKTITWSTTRHTVTREDPATSRKELFHFNVGSRVQFLPPAEDSPASLVTVRLEEQSPHAPVADSRARSGQSLEVKTAPVSDGDSANLPAETAVDLQTEPFAVEIQLRPGSSREVTP